VVGEDGISQYRGNFSLRRGELLFFIKEKGEGGVK